MIDMEINYEDCALVLKPNGGIEVYCPQESDASNVKLMRSLLIAIVHSVSESGDIPKLLEEIDQNIRIGTEISNNRLLH